MMNGFAQPPRFIHITCNWFTTSLTVTADRDKLFHLNPIIPHIIPLINRR